MKKIVNAISNYSKWQSRKKKINCSNVKNPFEDLLKKQLRSQLLAGRKKKIRNVQIHIRRD